MSTTTHEESEISVNLSSDHMLVVTDNSGTRKIKLVASQYTIGRETDNTVHLDSDFVSRYHAILRKVHHRDRLDTYRIIDGSASGKLSKNGIVLNAIHKVSSYDLQDGDIVTFAPDVHILYLAPKLI
ncbi:FHA domain-containing protein [Pseudanabaena galeata UHCC 0370]|jgi:pSer/pThr/pTyr-binding forkhead associated (FHA) protein|uniref:FHA domain-containing protein n=1 Tax=Pseudanabaena galeata UHCC 0370 TaxID=3110310 RepID=A0ABU5TJX6_9CYAN|nr:MULTISPECIES: FHA domain-containing protein [Pseudanabaena]MEA5478500.1 FHA domain-containing protein [Pseudanabaena galeata UHCC 0370]MEA5487034.1 FHA domain-containing protein [Pseudanabaena sp. CCNP1317]WGS71755.1 FHA domain-containing protein [Pseudanabaena galeata CCNP1313]